MRDLKTTVAVVNHTLAVPGDTIDLDLLCYDSVNPDPMSDPPAPTWTSSDPDVAAVDDVQLSGARATILAVGYGLAVITASVPVVGLDGGSYLITAEYVVRVAFAPQADSNLVRMEITPHV